MVFLGILLISGSAGAWNSFPLLRLIATAVATDSINIRASLDPHAKSAYRLDSALANRVERRKAVSKAFCSAIVLYVHGYSTHSRSAIIQNS